LKTDKKGENYMPESMFLTPKEVYDTLSGIVKKKATSPVYELFMYGVLAGIYISLGAAAAMTVLSGNLDMALAKFLAGVVFSVGLMLVIVPGAELFTGNVLMAIGIIDKRYNFIKLIRNWLIVYLGNFLGSLFIMFIVYYSGFLGSVDQPTVLGLTAIKIAHAKMALGFGAALLRGILCNILVCLAVIMSISSRSLEGKILGIFFPIMVFVLSGYEHSIANMYFLPLGLYAEGTFFSKFLDMLTSNIIPVTLGNIIGGLIVVLFHPKSGIKVANMMKDERKKSSDTEIG
jgi:formate/nitrite transporter